MESNKREESKICGKHASRAVFARRPGDIIRVFVSEKMTQEFGDLLKFCAQNHMAYRVAGEAELEKVSGARHHEGICVVANAPAPMVLADVVAAPGPGLILALDGVANPHNIGTLLRTAAHFGGRAVLVGGPLRRLSPAVYRTAEGAAEHVGVLLTDDLAPLLTQCSEAGFKVCATSSHKGRDLYEQALPPRMCILLGAERDGLSDALTATADQHLCIPGTSAVESLNVASSAAVFLAEHWRTQASS
ncbi:MAG: tRNA/rRNA methyltransferase YfiF [Myxococcales bacterium]|nr:tRNA/rRNA methyltransferase YfiF [Myxococcales bacterium]